MESAGIACASICSLTNRLPAARSALTAPTVLPFGCALRKSEHLLSGKPTSSAACGFNSPHRSPIRVCPPQERHSLREHLPFGKPTSSAACDFGSLHRSIIRVSKTAAKTLRFLCQKSYGGLSGRRLRYCWRIISMAAIWGGMLAVITPLWTMQTRSPGAYSRAAGVFT